MQVILFSQEKPIYAITFGKQLIIKPTLVYMYFNLEKSCAHVSLRGGKYLRTIWHGKSVLKYLPGDKNCLNLIATVNCIVYFM